MKRTADLRKEALDLVESRFKAGSASELEQAQAETELAVVTAEVAAGLSPAKPRNAERLLKVNDAAGTGLNQRGAAEFPFAASPIDRATQSNSPSIRSP